MASTHKVCVECGSSLTEADVPFGVCSIECAEKTRDRIWRLDLDLRIQRTAERALQVRRGRRLHRRDQIMREIRLLGAEWSRATDHRVKSMLELEEERCFAAWIAADQKIETLTDAQNTAAQRTRDLELELEGCRKIVDG
jgi:hypothetical protein